ncbi:MAG: Rrf2 family transcriptional regulator [Candidatus Omnitrophica bacterium]|nr:Rrf2 family transcriptional regulator [Candidatus Omnitrophota bacterium]
MRLSKKGEYAIKALLELALNQKNGINTTLITNIAEQENIPQRYLEHILLSFKNSGMLISKRGVGGGYTLNKLPRNISLGDIIRVADGPLSPLSYRDPKDDEELEGISEGLRGIMKEVGNAMKKIVDNISLEDMVKRTLDLIEQKKNVPNYVI